MERTPMASKKTRKRSRNGAMTKSDFVRSLPGNTPAKDVVERAAKQGMKISEKYVYVIRSNDKAHAAGGGRGRRGGRGRKVRAGGGGGESQLRRAIAELGLARARQLFHEVEAAFAG